MNTQTENAVVENQNGNEAIELLETTTRVSVISALVAGLIYCISLLA